VGILSFYMCLHMSFFIRVLMADCHKKCKSCCARKKAKENSTRPHNYKEDEVEKRKAK